MGEGREDWNGVMELFPNQMEMIVIVVMVCVCVCVCGGRGGSKSNSRKKEVCIFFFSFHEWFHKVRRFYNNSPINFIHPRRGNWATLQFLLLE